MSEECERNTSIRRRCHRDRAFYRFDSLDPRIRPTHAR
jgi:hypothetical protein